MRNTKPKYTTEGCELLMFGKSIQVMESEKAAQSIAKTLNNRVKKLLANQKPKRLKKNVFDTLSLPDEPRH